MQLNKLAFTLIELLVVIAIIGILSGLIVVSMSGVNQKAKIAKAQVFSNSLRNSLMLDLVSEWKFDEIIVSASTTTPDSWGKGNAGILSGASGLQNLPQLVTSNCVYGNCLSFDGTDDIVYANDSDSLDIIGKITISVWLKINSPTLANKGIVVKDGVGGYALILDYSVVDSKVSFITPTSANRKMTNDLADQNWHYVVCSFDSSNGSLKFYLDGNLDSNQTTTGTLAANTGNLWIGYRSNYFSGLMDEVRIYNAVVPISLIKENYYWGVNNLLINGSISKEEYLSRLNDYAVK